MGTGRGMRYRLFLVLFLGGCATIPDDVPTPDPLTALRARPSQALVILVDAPPPASLETFPALARLEKSGVRFPAATVGHLPNLAEANAKAVLTGRFPRRADTPPLIPFVDPGSGSPSENVFLRVKTTEEANTRLEDLQTVLENSGRLAKTAILVYFAPTHHGSVLPSPLKDPAVRKVTEEGGMQCYHLKRSTREDLAAFSMKLKLTTDVAEVYSKQVTKERAHYLRTHRAREVSQKSGVSGLNDKLVQTMATESSCDLLALPLSTAESLENEQKAMALLWSPNLKVRGNLVTAPLRLVDVAPSLLMLQGHSAPKTPFDGDSSSVDGLVDETIQ